MKFKRLLRLFALALMIALACILPVPLTLTRKDDAPKFIIEQIDETKDDEQKDNIKEIF